jgi:hypothetical protein
VGMLKNIKDLKKQTAEIQASMPPAGLRMAEARARMAGLSETLARETAAAHLAADAAACLADGTAVRQTVMINEMRQIGMVNFNLLVEFDLTVMPDEGVPYPATTQQTVSQMAVGRLQAGMTLQAAVDPVNPAAVWLDLTNA